ncbi:MAG: FkbM family methyltransferase [Candidatus Electrothrix sp. AS4_5]|nr:FkbM family methyltransferase [Candidatus Electrothrix gigas]MCI5189784.1 FkbM family methyltransferase [Candidatus Electrothrix gigas]
MRMRGVLRFFYHPDLPFPGWIKSPPPVCAMELSRHRNMTSHISEQPMIFQKIHSLINRFTPLSKRKSWALNELDRKLAPYLSFRGGFFIEAGGNDGISQSNTLYFERYLGWRGLLVEAIPSLAETCKENRPDCIVENCALVAKEYSKKTIEIHYRNLMSMVRGGLLNPEEEERFLESGSTHLRGEDEPYSIMVPARTLGSILNHHRIQRIDLLSLDVEGYEAEVLKGIDFSRHRPEHILLEVRKEEVIVGLLHPWYREVAVINQSTGYADKLYKRVAG